MTLCLLLNSYYVSEELNLYSLSSPRRVNAAGKKKKVCFNRFSPFGCHARCSPDIEIQNCFVKCGFSAAGSVKADDKGKNCKRAELQGHTDYTCTFNRFHNVDLSVPTNGDQPTSLLSQFSALCM